MALSNRFGAIKSVAADSTEDDTDAEEDGLLKSLINKQQFKYSRPEIFSFTNVRTDGSTLESVDDDSDGLDDFDPAWLDDFKSILSEKKNTESADGDTKTVQPTGRTSPLFKKISNESPDLPLKSLKSTLNKYNNVTEERELVNDCRHELIQSEEETASNVGAIAESNDLRTKQEQVQKQMDKEASAKRENHESDKNSVKKFNSMKDKKVDNNQTVSGDASSETLSEKEIKTPEIITHKQQDIPIKLPVVDNKSMKPKVQFVTEIKMNKDSEKILDFNKVNKDDVASSKSEISKAKHQTELCLANNVQDSPITTTPPSGDSYDTPVGKLVTAFKPVKTDTEGTKEHIAKAQRNQEVRKHKVLTINEAKSFPLDEILPVKKRKLSGDLLSPDKQTKPEKTADKSSSMKDHPLYESYFTSSNDHYSQNIIQGNHIDDYSCANTFHGTVYQPENQYETRVTAWSHVDYDNYEVSFPTAATSFPIAQQSLYTTVAQEETAEHVNQNSWPCQLPATDLSENHLWTAPYQNMLSQQTASDLQDFANRVNISSYMYSDIQHGVPSKGVGVAGDACSIVQETASMTNTLGDVSEKQMLSDMIDKMQQCIAIVESKTDREELLTMIEVLKKEMGNDTSKTLLSPATKLTSAGICVDDSCHQTVGGLGRNSPSRSPIDSNSGELKLEFEGRTMLKGGVKPRHIPKTTIRKIDRANPTDPRPFHKVQASRALKLPKFMRALWGDEKVDDMLAHDWGEPFERKGKPELYFIPKEVQSEKFYNPQREINKTKEKIESRPKSTRESNGPRLDPRIDNKNETVESQFVRRDPRIYGNISNEMGTALTMYSDSSQKIYCCNLMSHKCDLPSEECYNAGGCREMVTAQTNTDKAITKETDHPEDLNSQRNEHSKLMNIQKHIPVVVRSIHDSKPKSTLYQRNLVEELCNESKSSDQGLQNVCHSNLKEINIIPESDILAQYSMSCSKDSEYSQAPESCSSSSQVSESGNKIMNKKGLKQSPDGQENKDKVKKSSQNVSCKEWKKHIKQIEQDEMRAKNVTAGYDDDFGQREVNRDTSRERDNRPRKHRSSDKSDHSSRNYRTNDRNRSPERVRYGETGSRDAGPVANEPEYCHGRSYHKLQGSNSSNIRRMSENSDDIRLGETAFRRSRERNDREAWRNDRQSSDRYDKKSSDQIDRVEDNRDERRNISKSSTGMADDKISAERIDKRSGERSNKKSGSTNDGKNSTKMTKSDTNRTDRQEVVGTFGRGVREGQRTDPSIRPATTHENVKPVETGKKDLRHRLSRPKTDIKEGLKRSRVEYENKQYHATNENKSKFECHTSLLHEPSVNIVNLSDVSDNSEDEEYALEFHEIYGSKNDIPVNSSEGKIIEPEEEKYSMQNVEKGSMYKHKVGCSIQPPKAGSTCKDQMFLKTFNEIPIDTDATSIKTGSVKGQGRLFLGKVKQIAASTRFSSLKPNADDLKLNDDQRAASSSKTQSKSKADVNKTNVQGDKAFLMGLKQKLVERKNPVMKSNIEKKPELSDDLAFLACLKEKLSGGKPTITTAETSGDLEKKRLTDLDLELKDRAFLKMCKKNLEKKSKPVTAWSKKK